MTTPKPQWIARMYPPKVGRDHLGLGSVSSDQILPVLSPDINVLTFHRWLCSDATRPLSLTVRDIHQMMQDIRTSALPKIDCAK